MFDFVSLYSQKALQVQGRNIACVTDELIIIKDRNERKKSIGAVSGLLC